MKLKATERKKLSNMLHEFTEKYHDAIPICDINKTLAMFDLLLIQEDKTEWCGILLGLNGNTIFDLGIKSSCVNEVYETSLYRLYLSWYRIPKTGRYEINIYLT